MTAPTPTTWATVADVKTYTGIDVTAAQLTIASGTIDVAAGRTYGDVSRIGTRDQFYMKLALCYQAAWITAQFDMFQRMDIDSLGQSRSLTKFAPNAMTLGPNVKKALKRVSWLKSRSLHIQSPFTDGIGIFGTDPMSPGSDGLYAWTAEEG